MSIDEKELLHLAKLARLELSDEEKERFSEQISAILDYVRQLEELDTGSVDPASRGIDLLNVFRKDEIKECADTEILLENAPMRSGRLIKTKGVK